MNRRFSLTVASFAALLIVLPTMSPIGSQQALANASQALALAARGRMAPSQLPKGSGAAQVQKDYAHLPAAFEPNLGQAAPDVLYLSRSGQRTLALTHSGAMLSLPAATRANGWRSQPSYIRTAPTRAASLTMAFAGGNPGARVDPTGLLSGKENYLYGADPSRWITDVPTYGGITYHDLYPGIDLSFSGTGGALEYTFTVAPGADPGRIRLAFSGQSGLSIGGGGVLEVKVGAQSLAEPAPVIFQVVGTQRRSVSGGFVLAEAGGVGFRVAAHDPSLPLVIDPILSYSTYLGGSADDYGTGVAVDGSGNAYITGITASTNFPVSSSYKHGGYDAFLTKLNPSGSGFIYSTYIGGARDDEAGAIRIDSTGQAYLTGVTDSTNFPTTTGAFQRSFKGGVWDAFLAKISPAGNRFSYSTYLGGTGDDEAFGVTLDATGTYPILTGTTSSTNFPVRNAFQRTYAGSYDAFVTKVNPNPSQPLVYSTYLGGTSVDVAFGVALRDSVSRVLVTGTTHSTNFPHTTGAFQATNKGGYDAFLTLVYPNGNGLNYSTYLGGSGNHDEGFGVVADPSAFAYLTGVTNSTNFPHTSGAYQETYNGGYDIFVTKVNTQASQPIPYSTYLGETGDEVGAALALDSSNNAYLVGTTTSHHYPTTFDAFGPAFSGGPYDVVFSELDPTGSVLVSSTFLGGSDDDEAGAIALDPSGNSYVVGVTNSTTFPTAGTPFQDSLAGSFDAYAAKVIPGRPVGIVTFFPLPEDSGSGGVAAGPDGNLWITEYMSGKIGRLTTKGGLTEFLPSSAADDITSGPDGNMWFLEYYANAIGRITTTGSIMEFPVPTGNAGLAEIAAGPDGNLWFTEADVNQIGRVSPSGSFQEFPIPTPDSGPAKITVGSDGKLWFIERRADQIGRMSLTGSVTEFPVAGDLYPAFPDIATGPDGNLWFTEEGNHIGQMTLTGQVTEFYIGPGAERIAPGPDANLWFTSGGDWVGRITDAPMPVLGLHPNSGLSSTRVRVSGSGFGSYEPISLVFIDSANGMITLQRVRTDASGHFRQKVTIPSNATLGSQAIQATGTISHLVAEQTFQVT
jgi:streptogramin lyase